MCDDQREREKKLIILQESLRIEHTMIKFLFNLFPVYNCTILLLYIINFVIVRLQFRLWLKLDYYQKNLAPFLEILRN